MTPITRIALVVALAALATAASAQTFKCTDKSGKVTYTNVKCGDLGLKEAGEVPDRLNTSPAYQPTEQAETRQQRSSPPAAPPAEAAKPAAPPAAAPKQGEDPDKRCFKTPQGFRCNEGDNEK